MDQAAIASGQATGWQLMQRAAAAALESLRRNWPKAQRVIVFCGAGSNAGDGYLLARLAQVASLQVQVFAVIDPARLKGDAARAFEHCSAAGVPIERWQAGSSITADLVVDSLLGTGLDRELEGVMAQVVTDINGCGLPVLAIDLPSGLDADTGQVCGVAVKANRTITFVALKAGLFLQQGPEYCGALEFSALDLEPPVARDFPPALRRITSDFLQQALPMRSRDSHKGQHGHVLIIGGDPAMPGAVCLAGEAALRAGAGKVTVAVHPEAVASVIAARPELMCIAASQAGDMGSVLQQVDVVAIGPGLGQSDWARELLNAALSSGKPLVVDADALNLLAQAPKRHADWILTPHPGEAARLLGMTTAGVQANRLATLEKLCERYAGVVVLKGAGTLVGSSNATVQLCDRGNPAMASAGMGDVLTGMVAAFRSQGLEAEVAAAAAVLVHALAGDRAAAGQTRGLLAGDLMAQIGRAASPPWN